MDIAKRITLLSVASAIALTRPIGASIGVSVFEYYYSSATIRVLLFEYYYSSSAIRVCMQLKLKVLCLPLRNF
jgi:hypothetical protein